MQTRYTRTLGYDCQRHALDYGTPRCQSLVGEPLERLVAEQILEVVTPAGLELSLRATAECQRERAALETQWHQRLERADQDAARAYRQYDAVDPENRLVARTLERRWEEALLAQRALEEDSARFRQTQPQGLTAAERGEIETLAGNLPTVWHAPQTGVAEKRQILRLLLERVVVWAPAASPDVTVHLHWSLGTVTEHRVRRSVRSWGQVAHAAELRRRVAAGQAAGWSSRRMAEELNAAGYRTPRGQAFTAESLRQLRARGGPGGKPASPDRRPQRRVPGPARDNAAADQGPKARAEPLRPRRRAQDRPAR
jgi:hypothetical protein